MSTFLDSYPMDIVHYEWMDIDSPPLKNPHLKLLQHNLELKKLQLTLETLNVKYSCLAVMFILERQISHHLMQVFAPSALIVMLSWFSFWIGIDAIPGRVTLVVTSLLSLFTQFSGIRGGLPPASYINGIDIWMATCMLFVFCSFAEFVLVKFFDKQRQVFFRQQMKQTLTPLSVSDMEKGQGQEVQGQENPMKPRSAWTIPVNVQDNFPHNWFKHPSWSVDWVVTIDHAARVIFPLAFLIFNTFYWPVLLTRMY
ncbi:glycine receptor subunit alpha-3-like [Limulus polyphemus]|uniref:Glycine receptor subunit alpha-3-like n=1 Tax=Limulus polyphemus TaxID=6850 RepID=A0ABM1RXJ4_LIMPO|nr:glycine receptor subunit alpha-3-like [Limulus polyphemus]